MKQFNSPLKALLFCAAVFLFTGTAFSQLGSAAFGTMTPYGTFNQISGTTTMLSKTITLPIPTTVKIECNTYMFLDSSRVRYGFSINGSTTTVHPYTTRFLGDEDQDNVVGNAQTSAMFSLPAGTHTIRFLGTVVMASPGGIAWYSGQNIMIEAYEYGVVVENDAADASDDIKLDGIPDAK